MHVPYLRARRERWTKISPSTRQRRSHTTGSLSNAAVPGAGVSTSSDSWGCQVLHRLCDAYDTAQAQIRKDMGRYPALSFAPASPPPFRAEKGSGRTDVQPLGPPLNKAHLPFDFDFFIFFFAITLLL